MSRGKDENKIFTIDEVRKFDGKEGRPLYLVFKGDVYDLSTSRLWVKGMHMQQHSFDEKLEETIRNAPHHEEVLSRFKKIGVVKQDTLQESSTEDESAEQKEKGKRREFLKLVAAGGGALAIIAMAGTIRSIGFMPKPTATASWPRLKVTNINDLQLLIPFHFNYPLMNTPNLLVKLGVKAKNGIGPEEDIVAFSDICQHLGCFYGFVPPDGSPPCNSGYKAPEANGYCCCHGSIYDFVDGAKVIGGPAPRPVPQVQLELDQATGDIYAVSMGPPTIFGHGPPGTTKPELVLQYDTSGGTLVST
jgi:arsenite oxidase small subunit